MSFIISKILWVFLSPGNLLVLLLLAGAFLGVAHDPLRRNIGRRISFTAALILFFIAIFPVGGWLLAPLENRFPAQAPEHVAGIILIGGDEKPRLSEARGQPVFLDSGRRYIEFASLARQYPQARLVFSGGSPALAVTTGMHDADVAKQALADLGVPVERMVFEDASRNTHENAEFSYNLIHPTPEQTWLLVTSAFHMPRAMASFRKAGWVIDPAPAGYLSDGTFSARLEFNLGEHLLEMSWAAHEYYGLLAYWLMGYIDDPWPH